MCTGHQGPRGPCYHALPNMFLHDATGGLRRMALFAALAVSAGCAASLPKARSAGDDVQAAAANLVLFIVVDQLPVRALVRVLDRLGQRGIGRLLREGVR